jgi:hypothetical protein
VKSRITWALLQVCGTEWFIQQVLRKICNLAIRDDENYYNYCYYYYYYYDNDNDDDDNSSMDKKSPMFSIFHVSLPITCQFFYVSLMSFSTYCKHAGLSGVQTLVGWVGGGGAG